MKAGFSPRRFGRDARGVAGVEFAFIAMFVLGAIINVVDVANYAFLRLQVDAAAQAGAQIAWTKCYDVTTMLPATQNCAALNDALTAAIQGTSLGSQVTLSQSPPAEAYYC